MRYSVAAALVLAAFGAAALADEKKGGAATPKEALDRLQKAGETGDVALMEGLFVEPFGSAFVQMAQAGEAMNKASDELKAAATEKLGAESVAALELDKRPRGGAFQGKIEIVDLKEEGDRATATVRSTPKDGMPRDEPVAVVKKDGTWKIEPPSNRGHAFSDEDARQITVVADVTKTGAGKYKGLADAVRSGEIKTLDDLKAKKKEVDMAMMMAMMSAMRPATPPAPAPAAPTGTAK